MTTVRVLARAERAEFVDLLQGLTAQQWEAPSLCEGWSVRDVVAHTIGYLRQSPKTLVGNVFRVGFNIERLNARGLDDYTDATPEQLVDLMCTGIDPSGVGAMCGGRVALIECLIHQQDIRRPLGATRTIDEERLRVTLNFARISPVIAGAHRTRGLRLVATDMDWSVGCGPEVRGPAESLLLAMTGRAAAVSGEMSGAGVALLR